MGPPKDTIHIEIIPGRPDSRVLISPSGRQHLGTYIKTTFDLAYYLLLFPFKFKLVPGEISDGGGYKVLLTKWVPQQFLCALYTLTGLPWILRDIRLGYPDLRYRKNPSMYFFTVLKITSAVAKLIVFNQIFFKQNEFTSILNYIVEDKNKVPVSESEARKKYNYLKHKVVAICICFLYIGISLMDWVTGRTLGYNHDFRHDLALYANLTTNNTFLVSWWHQIVVHGRYNFFLFEGPPNLENLDWLNCIIGIFSGVGYLHRRIFGSFSDLLILMHVLTLWHSSKAFSHFLLENTKATPLSPTHLKVIANITNKHMIVNLKTKSKWIEVLEQYNALKMLCEKINIFLGFNITFFLIGAMLDYAVSFDEVFEDHLQNWSKLAGLAFFFLEACVILVLAADVSYQVGTLKEWLSVEDNRWEIGSEQLYLILNELDSNGVAVKANNVFTITYSLIANMVGVTVTYFIICVQA